MKKVGKTLVPRLPDEARKKMKTGAWHEVKTKPKRHPKHRKEDQE